MFAPGALVSTIAAPGRIKVADLAPKDGFPSEVYKSAVNALWTSLARFNAAIIQLPVGDDLLMKYALDSARVYFQHKRRTGPDLQCLPGMEDPNDWNRTCGYFAEPHYGKETYDYRPGRLPGAEDGEGLPPSCLPDAFSSLGTTARIVLEAIARSLDLRSFAFTDLLDNVPLKTNEVSSSVLSACCHGRRYLTMGLGDQQEAQPMPEDTEPRAEKGLLALIKSDRAGLYVRDPQNRWVLVDNDLGPGDVVVLTGLSLYQATGGYVGPALYKTDLSSATACTQAAGGGLVQPSSPLGVRCSLTYKLMARASAIIHCSAMAAAGHQIAAPFQAPIAVQGFMQRAVPLDQIIATPPKGPKMIGTAEKPRKRKSRGEMSGDRGLAPSKRLRLEAQRVLKEKVQDLAEMKQLKIRFCNLKECEEQHMQMEDPPCAYLRSQLGWPSLVPFVHPHDLPNRGKQSFLEAFEPGWTERQGGDIPNFELGTTPKREGGSRTLVVHQDRYSLKSIYDYLRDHSKQVPTGKPQVVGHKVDLTLLCRCAAEAGGRQQFEMSGGFQRFIHDTFALENASEKERERAIERLKKLYDQVLHEYVEHIVMNSQLDDGSLGEQLHLEDGNMGAQEEQPEISRQLDQSNISAQLEEGKWETNVDDDGGLQLTTADNEVDGKDSDRGQGF